MTQPIRSRFSESDKTPPKEVGTSLTQQNFAADADVNNIVRRHLRGIGRNLSNIAPNGTRQPMYGDFSSIDYQTMLNKVADVDNMFRRLPARLRGRFNNRPEMMLRFAEDPANLKESIKLGLIQLPPGIVVTEQGELVEQLSVVTEAGNAQPPSSPPPGTPPAPKADPEANPDFRSKK